MTKKTEISKGKDFSCNTVRRKTQREREAVNIGLLADGGMGGTYSNDSIKIMAIFTNPYPMGVLG